MGGYRADRQAYASTGGLHFCFDGEDLVCEKVYFDHATVLRQLVA
jgi:hypothetical protein